MLIAHGHVSDPKVCTGLHSTICRGQERQYPPSSEPSRDHPIVEFGEFEKATIIRFEDYRVRRTPEKRRVIRETLLQVVRGPIRTTGVASAPQAPSNPSVAQIDDDGGGSGSLLTSVQRSPREAHDNPTSSTWRAEAAAAPQAATCRDFS